MKLRVLAAAALVMAALWPAAPARAAACAIVVDPEGVLAASSRLDGAVAALQRADVAAGVVVHAGELLGSSTHCSSFTDDAGAVIVELSAASLDVRVTGSGSVTRRLAQRAQHEIKGRLAQADPDAASAVAQGLELVWQAHDGRELRRSVDVEGAVVPVGATPPVDVPGTWLSIVMSRILSVLAMGAGAFAAAGAGVSIIRRHRALEDLRRRAAMARTDLAERYVDLDDRVAMAVTEIERAVVTLQGDAAERVRSVVARRMASIEAAAARAGTDLLSTATPLRRATRAELETVAERCRSATAEVDEAVRLLGRSLEVAGDAVSAVAAPEDACAGVEA